MFSVNQVLVRIRKKPSFVSFVKRYKSKKNVTTPCDLALNHFDDFYQSVFKNKWHSVRLALLSRSKSVAVVNNFGNVEETEKLLQEKGAYDLKELLQIHKNIYITKSEKRKETSEEKINLSEVVSSQSQKQQKSVSNLLYQNDDERELKSGSENDYDSDKAEEGFDYDPGEAMTSLDADLKQAKLAYDRLILPNSSNDKIALYEFVPTNKLRGLESFIPEAEYYKYYQDKIQWEPNIQPEFDLDFPEDLKVFAFDRGDVTEFPEPRKCANDVYNYLKVDGADVLAVLALGIKPGDNVLHLTQKSANIAFCILQTFRSKHLICSTKKILEKTFSKYLFDYSSVWKEMLLLTDLDLSDFERSSMDFFDKILVEVPSTFDKTSLFDFDQNPFAKNKIKERIKLPQDQIQMLMSALKLVKPGGAVVYTTSSLSPVQNDGVVAEVLQRLWETDKIQLTAIGFKMAFNKGSSPEIELEGEFMPVNPYPIPIDISDGIERDIRITQEIFGVITQYGSDFEVMRFTLHNTLKDGIKVQVMSLGAALVGVIAPDRKGVYKDVVPGFDNVHHYYSPLNPGFGRVTSLCPLPYNLEKVVWDWDFDRDEGSVTFSTTFYRIDLILSVKYTLNICNEIIVDLKACGSKILPISLTSQVYWNMAGHCKGEEALRHHALSINSDRIWKHYNHKLKNFFPIHDTVLDFRQPTLMDNPEIFGEKKFEHVYVVSKGCEQTVAFVARLIHPRSCRYVEIFSDQPWILCNTLNKFPRRDWDLDPCPDDYYDDDDYGECSEYTSDLDPCASDDERARLEELSKELDEIPGKGGCFYRKYGSFCVTPLSDLTGFDPVLRAGNHYSHRIIYKLGIYRRYMKRKSKKTEFFGEGGEGDVIDDITDIKRE